MHWDPRYTRESEEEPIKAYAGPRHTSIWKLEAALKCRSCWKDRWAPARAHDQADRSARDHTLQVGASGRGEVRGPARRRRFSSEGFVGFPGLHLNRPDQPSEVPGAASAF